MVKNKGFTLIEIMVVIAIVSILLTILMPVFEKMAEIDSTDTVSIEVDVNDEALDADMNYIPRDKRLSEYATLMRHDDGSLWACVNNTGNCYMVKQ